MVKISGGFRFTDDTYTVDVAHPEHDSWHLHAVKVFYNSTFTWRIDGVQVATGTLGAFSHSEPSMGQDLASSATASAYIGEFISAGSEIGDADIGTLETYLNNKWDIYPVLNAVGEAQVTWTDGDTIPCGLEFSPFKFRSRELLGEGQDVGEILVRCRVPMKYYDTIQKEDRIRITKRHGVALTTAETYTVQGFAERGPSALVLNLKRVEL
jgi:hypothetical protein